MEFLNSFYDHQIISLKIRFVFIVYCEYSVFELRKSISFILTFKNYCSFLAIAFDMNSRYTFRFRESRPLPRQFVRPFVNQYVSMTRSSYECYTASTSLSIKVLLDKSRFYSRKSKACMRSIIYSHDRTLEGWGCKKNGKFCWRGFSKLQKMTFLCPHVFWKFP